VTPPLPAERVLAALAQGGAGARADWLDTFVPFSALHYVTVAFFAALMLGSCYLGRCWRETARERRVRIGWGWAVLAYQSWYTAWYLLPENFTWEKGLPLELCDLAAFVAGLAMVTQWRTWRTLLYFWGIGLSTQAFFTPTLGYGVGHLKFWMFWIGHTMIVGSAVYDVVVLGYRPGLADLRRALAVSTFYCLAVFFVNVWLSEETGRLVNYAYIGNTRPRNPTIIDKLGPWPRRVIWIVVIVVADYALLYAVWPVLGAIRGRGGGWGGGGRGGISGGRSGRRVSP
jgi:hypothetical integral membrane protein (TIGR02206 family)